MVMTKEIAKHIKDNPFLGIMKDYTLPVDTSGNIDNPWVDTFKDFVGQYKQTKGEIKMGKTRYVTLKDRKNRPRIIIAAVEYWDNTETIDVAFGMAIRSDDDKHDLDTGKRLAYARAKRAILNRKPCFVSRAEAIKNIWSLKFDDFRRLMRLTGGLTSDFMKGDKGYDYADIKDFMEDLNHDVVKTSVE